MDTTVTKRYVVRPEHFRDPFNIFLLVPLWFGLILLVWITIAFLSEAMIPSWRITTAPLASRGWFLSQLRSALMFSTLYTIYFAWRTYRRRLMSGFEFEIEPNRLVEHRNGDLRTVYRNRLQTIRESRGFARTPGLLVQADNGHIFIPAGQPEYAEIKTELARWQESNSP